ncbi:hypothetical protein EWB00_000711, partial [Schistosoma japonicum]
AKHQNIELLNKKFTDFEKKLQRNRRQLSSKNRLAAKIITTINLRSKIVERIDLFEKQEENPTNNSQKTDEVTEENFLMKMQKHTYDNNKERLDLTTSS